MPYSFALEQIREILSDKSKKDADHQLLKDLFKDAVKSGKLKSIAYDPVKRRMILQAPAKKASGKTTQD